MPQYYRVKVDDNGKAFLVDDEGVKLPPHRNMEIAETIADTAKQPRFVYFGWSEERQLHKIGISIEPDRRSKEVGFEVIYTIPCEMWGDYSAFNLEQLLHKIYTLTGQHIEGEWFRLTKSDIRYWQPEMDDTIEDTFFIANKMYSMLCAIHQWSSENNNQYPFVLNNILSVYLKFQETQSPSALYLEVIRLKGVINLCRQLQDNLILNEIDDYLARLDSEVLYERMKSRWDEEEDNA